MDRLFDYSKASRYAYSVAKIRFFETKLLTREKVLRMVSAEDVSECFRMLEEAGYNVALGSPADFNPVLRKEHQKTLDVLRLLSMDKRMHTLFAIRYDFHNLKTAIKEIFSMEDLSNAYQIGGILDQRDIKRSILDDDFRKLGEMNKVFSEAFAEIRKTYEETPAPKLIDIITDRYMYKEILRRGNEIGNNFVTRIFVREIDLVNIRTFFRMRYLQKKRIDFVEAFIYGGDFRIDFFLKNYENDFYTLKTIFKGTEFLGLITDGSTYLEENSSFLRFERLSNEYFIKYVKATRWTSFGVEPLVAYFYAKEKELMVVRTILTGKQNELSYDEIKEEIPDEYI
jgi:V/A-type H+-transporting ATPase subunit C